MSVFKKPHKSPHCENCESREKNVFCALPPEGVEILDRAKVTTVFKRGEHIFREDDRPRGLYCVNGGLVKLESLGAGGNNHILRMVPEGGMLGYRSLFADEPYRASAVAAEEAAICFIPKSAIERLIADYPEVAMRFLANISRELREAEHRLKDLTDKSVGERIAESLLFLKDNFPEQKWTRREIAEWAGTTPETVMRTLADFEAKGHIEQRGRGILIKDRRALMALANLAP